MLVDLIFVYVIILFVIVSLNAMLVFKAVELLIDDARDGDLATILIENVLLGPTIDIFETVETPKIRCLPMRIFATDANFGDSQTFDDETFK